jgi:3',5'-cyclic AMP phosphodiesterase CpdA
VKPTRVLHVSDLHFGWPADLDQIDALEAMIAREQYDVVAVAGDLAQRARAGEFQRALVFLKLAARSSQVIVVPGNHDTAWWFAPLGVGDRSRLHAKYKRYISPELEPVLHVPGVTFVGLNSAHGVAWGSVTGRPRDVSIMGHLSVDQLHHAADEFARAPEGDARVVVMHHNAMRGALSRRYGITRHQRVVDAFSAMRVDLVLSGHDHQMAVQQVGKTVYVTAGTVSVRSRGGLPSAFDVSTISDAAIEVRTMTWSGKDYIEGKAQCFAR